MGRPKGYKVYHVAYQREAIEYRSYLLSLGYKKSTCQSRYLYLKNFFSWLEGVGIYEIDHITGLEISNFHEEIENRISSRTNEKLRQKTVYEKMRCVQMYLDYLLKIGKLKMNPSSHLKISYGEEALSRRIFSQEEIGQLYAATETIQERILLHIGYGCGLRVHEMSEMNKRDLRLQDQLLIVEKGKNNKRRLIPIGETICSEIGAYLREENQEGDAMFYNHKGQRMQEWTFNKMLKNLIRRTVLGKELSAKALKKIGMHSLRHSIATHLIENGMPLEQVQQFLGHSQIESTEIYTHIRQEQIAKMDR